MPYTAGEAEMTMTLEEMAARLAALEDKEAIRALKARYLRACDLKQLEVVRECFLPGPVRIAYENFPMFTDRDGFVELFRAAACQPGVYDIHHATNWEIELADEARATGKWSLNFRTILTGPRKVIRLAVEYEDIYLKREGRWWIAETTSRITSTLTEQVGEDGNLTASFSPNPPPRFDG